MNLNFINNSDLILHDRIFLSTKKLFLKNLLQCPKDWMWCVHACVRVCTWSILYKKVEEPFVLYKRHLLTLFYLDECVTVEQLWFMYFKKSFYYSAILKCIQLVFLLVVLLNQVLLYVAAAIQWILKLKMHCSISYFYCMEHWMWPLQKLTNFSFHFCPSILLFNPVKIPQNFCFCRLNAYES